MPSAYAAAAWSYLFAVMSFYWALGGMIGAETLGSAFTDPELRNDPAFVLFVWVTGFLKIALGALALALVQPWGRRLPRRLLMLAVWGIGIGLTLYGIALLVQHALILAGATDIPASIGSMNAVRWHLFFWDPFWLVGGVLFLSAARASRQHKPMNEPS